MCSVCVFGSLSEQLSDMQPIEHTSFSFESVQFRSTQSSTAPYNRFRAQLPMHLNSIEVVNLNAIDKIPAKYIYTVNNSMFAPAAG